MRQSAPTTGQDHGAHQMSVIMAVADLARAAALSAIVAAESRSGLAGWSLEARYEWASVWRQGRRWAFVAASGMTEVAL